MRMAMMAITTSSSISVKPDRGRAGPDDGEVVRMRELPLVRERNEDKTGPMYAADPPAGANRRTHALRIASLFLCRTRGFLTTFSPFFPAASVRTATAAANK